MTAYYNEIDPFAAQWLRNLISAGLIAKGEVDERSIEDVRPDDLRGFIQCHFFAGIAIWPYALRRAGFPDDREVWTGSCPCQSHSQIGKRKGFADERHLWPAWFHLIGERRPREIFGEQVEGDGGKLWLDLVQSDLEGIGYAIGAPTLPAAGFGAFQRRYRIYFVARPVRTGWAEGRSESGNGQTPGRSSSSSSSVAGTSRENPGSSLVCAERPGLQGLTGSSRDGTESGRVETHANGPIATSGEVGIDIRLRDQVEWVLCRDPSGPKWRPVQPGTFPMAAGTPGRVGRLRAYGNGLHAKTAEEFIKVAMEVCP